MDTTARGRGLQRWLSAHRPQQPRVLQRRAHRGSLARRPGQSRSLPRRTRRRRHLEPHGADDTHVVSVRQNLQPLVTDGQVNPVCASGGERDWGDTVGQAAFVDRSGFGITADGHEIYVAGPALSVCGLGHVLADAGVVRGMELDINPALGGRRTSPPATPAATRSATSSTPPRRPHPTTTSPRRAATGSAGPCARNLGDHGRVGRPDGLFRSWRSRPRCRTCRRRRLAGRRRGG